MSNGIGRSKENLPTDANHVSAKDRAYQKRMAKQNNKSVMRMRVTRNKAPSKAEGALF